MSKVAARKPAPRPAPKPKAPPKKAPSAKKAPAKKAPTPSKKPTTKKAPTKPTTTKKPTTGARVDRAQKSLQNAHTKANKGVDTAQRNANSLHNKANSQVNKGQTFANKFHGQQNKNVDSLQRKATDAHKKANTQVDNTQSTLRNQHKKVDQKVNNAQSTANVAHTVGDMVVDQVQNQITSKIPSWLGGGLINQGIDKVQGTARQVHRKADQVVDNTQRGANVVHKVADHAVNQGQKKLDQVHNGANKAVDQGQKKLDQVHNDANNAIDQGQKKLDQVHKQADKLVDQTQNVANVAHAVADAGVDKIQEAADIERQITNGLKRDGDNFTLGAGGNVSVELKGALNGQMKISRVGDGENPNFRIEAGGEGAFGIVAPTNVKLGGTLGLDAEAMAKLGGKMEFDFKNAEDAARGARILAQTGAANGLKATGGLPGKVAGHFADISAEDRKFLMDHASGISFNGGALGEAVARLGIPLDDNMKLGGLSAKANIAQDLTGRFQFPVRDDQGNVTQAPRFTFTNGFSGQLAGGAGLGLSANKGDDLVRTGSLGAGSLNGNLSLSNTYELPKDLTADAFFKDPAAALKSLATGTRPIDTSVNANFQGVRGLGGNSHGHELATQFNINPTELAQSGFVNQLFTDPQAALKTLGDKTNLTVTDREFQTRGLKVSPEIGIAGVGVGADLQATRENTLNKTTQTMTATEFAQRLQQLQQLLNQ